MNKAYLITLFFISMITSVLVCLLPTNAYGQDTQQTTQKPKPCTSDPYRHFDFWLGDWKVHNKDGKHVGDSKIQSIMSGCAISEQWTSVGGYRGVSYNFYDKNKQQWHQTWIGIDGNPLYLDGALINKKMVLQSETKAKDGKVLRQKITWTLLVDGRVSQHWQVSKDQGKTWSDSFLGFYSRNPIISIQ